MNKRELILGILKPYFIDPNLCSMNSTGDYCEYLNENGKTCAIGKCLDKSHPKYESFIRENVGVKSLNPFGFNLNDMLMEEYKNRLCTHEWRIIQSIHDKLATSKYDECNKAIVRLESRHGVNLAELHHLLEKIIETNSVENHSINFMSQIGETIYGDKVVFVDYLDKL